MSRSVFSRVFIMCWFSPVWMLAQEIHHVQYGLNASLKTNRLYDLHLAQDGLLYIATDNGFWSYNGLTFTKHEQDGLHTEDITNFHEDKRGRLFFQNFKGKVFIWEEEKQVLYEDTTTQQLGFAMKGFCVLEDHIYYWNQDQLVVRQADSLVVTSLPPPPPQTSWRFQCFGTQGLMHRQRFLLDPVGGLSRFTPTGLTPVPLPLKKLKRFFHPGYGDQASMYDEEPAPNGRIMLPNQQVLVDLNQCKDTLVPLSVKKINDQPWVACRNGLYLPHLNQYYLKGAYIADIVEDNEGNVWIATTNRGLLKVPNTGYYYYPSLDHKPDLILKHRDKIIFSNMVGDLFYWSDQEKKAKQFFSNIHKSQIKNITYDSLDRIYISSGLSTVLFDEHFNQIKTMTWGYGAVHVNPSGWFKSRSILIYSKMSLMKQMVYDSWEEQLNNDLYRVSAYDNNIRPIYILSFHKTPKDRLIHKQNQWILALHQDTLTCIHDTYIDSICRYVLPPNSQKIHVHNHRIWIEFKDQLLEYDVQGRILNTIPRTGGLEQDITHLSMDGQHMAITTKAAIYLYDAVTLEYLHKFTSEAGIASVDFDKAWFYDGNLYVNGSKGISTLLLEGDYHKGQPKLWVKTVLVNKKQQEGTVFSYDQNNIQLNVALRSFTAQGKLYWRLNKKAWKELEGKPTITLDALQHGTYTIEAYFENELGARSAIATYQFVIKRPYWWQWWFLTLIGSGMIGVGVFLYRLRIRQIQTRNKLDNQLIVFQMTALKSQMNPHFVFNALNSIQSLVRFNKNKEAYKYINKFATLLRQTLYYSDKDFIPLEQEVELLRNYLDMENMRLDGELDFEICLDGTLDVAIPSMIVQPFVENAIKHGLLHKTTGQKQLSISFELQGALLLCTITDNGIGRARAKVIQQQSIHESFSTGATQKRLELLQQLQHQELGVYYTDLKDEQGKALGTKVRITLPIQN